MLTAFHRDGSSEASADGWPPGRADAFSQPIGLYISVPFCRSKCTFCNFASGVYPVSQHARYVERLGRELHAAHRQAVGAGLVLPQRVDSIYLGGGTPSVLEPALLQQLFTSIQEVFLVTPSAEITMECAPGQIDQAVLKAMVECGVNRVSLGVQSFVDRETATSGRLHNKATTLMDVARLRQAGIPRLSLDLIAGLPHQTRDSWRESLGVLLSTGVEHASVYMLEVDDDSRLGREMLGGGARYHAAAVPNDDTIAAMFEEAREQFCEAGLEQYELSNFAIAGQASAHNQKYWQRAPYLGVGVDAHSMLRRAAPLEGEGRATRFGYGDSLEDFLQAGSLWQLDPLTRHAELEEAWFLGLRLSQGVCLEGISHEFGDVAVNRFMPTLRQLEMDSLVTMEERTVRLTDRGKLISNNVFAAILEVGDEEPCLS